MFKFIPVVFLFSFLVSTKAVALDNKCIPPESHIEVATEGVTNLVELTGQLAKDYFKELTNLNDSDLDYTYDRIYFSEAMFGVVVGVAEGPCLKVVAPVSFISHQNALGIARDKARNRI